jgi:uncharacterized protein YuzE
MKANYDKEADAAYIYLKKISQGEVKHTIELNKNIILDFNCEMRLVGIEILSASKVIPEGAVAKIQTA